MYSTVLILPATLQSAGNQVAEAMGWGPGNYSVPLSGTGAEPATHFGLHVWSSEEFKGWVEGTIPLPPGMESAQVVIDALIYSFRSEAVPLDHFAEVLQTNSLVRIEEVAE